MLEYFIFKGIKLIVKKEQHYKNKYHVAHLYHEIWPEKNFNRNTGVSYFFCKFEQGYRSKLLFLQFQNAFLGTLSYSNLFFFLSKLT